LVEAPAGVGKTRIALEFVREFWRRRGRYRVLVVVPRRALAYNPWKKEIGKWMSDLKPKCLILSGFMLPRERMLALSSFQGDFLLMTAIALNNDYILGRIKLDSFDKVIFDEAHRVVALGEEFGQYRYSVHYKQLALNLIASKKIVVTLNPFFVDVFYPFTIILIFTIVGSLFCFSVVGIGLGMCLGCPWIYLYVLIAMALAVMPCSRSYLYGHLP
jgi:hypothetical protein